MLRTRFLAHCELPSDGRCRTLPWLSLKPRFCLLKGAASLEAWPPEESGSAGATCSKSLLLLMLRDDAMNLFDLFSGLLIMGKVPEVLAMPTFFAGRKN